MSTRTSLSPQQRALRYLATQAHGEPLDPTLRVTLNFHPDHLADGRPILYTLAEDNVYHSTFVTGTSDGGLTSSQGTDRWRWESRMFGGAYDDAPDDERPIYGGLNYRRWSVGAAPRFGSAHFRLGGGVLARTSFCYPDSAEEPCDVGVAQRMPLIPVAERSDRDLLDDYIEAHVHGGVRIDRDVEALVLDPCYRGTFVESVARRLPCALEWHEGFRLQVSELRRHPGYRGRAYVELGEQLAEHGWITPRVIGDASRSERCDEEALKYLWHYLARFGAPEETG